MIENASQITIDNLIVLFIALYGAVLSTFVLFWDIYKWKSSGPKIMGEIQTNMIGVNVQGSNSDKKITVNLSNNGDKPTTINSLNLLYYKSSLTRIIQKPQKTFFVPIPSQSHPIPHLLNTGTTWLGIIDQTNEIEKLAKDGILICTVHFSHTKKNIMKLRININ